MAVEVALGVLLLTVCATVAEVRFAIATWLAIASDAMWALPGLLRIDASATATTVAIAVVRLAIPLVPIAVLIRSSPWQRRMWLLPTLAILIAACSTMSPAAGSRASWWFAIAATSLIATLLQRIRWLAWTAALPMLLLLEIVYPHAVVPAREVHPASRAHRLAVCASRPGERPQGLHAELVRPYHGINRVDKHFVLLTGEGVADGGGPPGSGRPDGPILGSWWMRRQPDGRLAFDLPSRATGNLWRGCILDGTLWMARANAVFGARRPDARDGVESVRFVSLPSHDIDFGEATCDPARRRIFVGEGTGGGLWEVDPEDLEKTGIDEAYARRARRHPVGGIALFPRRRYDGQIVVQSTSRSTVFDPDGGTIRARLPTALLAFGFDVCEADGALAVPDLLGRVRIFALDADGHYRFEWGISLFAPRRVAFSGDCSRIGVTSTDDRRVFIVNRSTRNLVETFEAGPALRDIAPTDLRELSWTDMCSVTTYRW